MRWIDRIVTVWQKDVCSELFLKGKRGSVSCYVPEFWRCFSISWKVRLMHTKRTYVISSLGRRGDETNDCFEYCVLEALSNWNLKRVKR